MVGEEVVDHNSEINDLPEGAGEKRILKPRAIFERRPHPMWTYFIRGPEGIKIGKSRNPKERRRGLQLAHATELKIIIAVPASIISEAAAHERFQHLKMSGEWFRAEPELLDFIETLRDPAEIEPPAPKYADPIIGRLHALRDKYGAESAVGHCTSNLAEQLHNMKTYKSPSWASHKTQTLPWMMEFQLRRIEQLTK